VLCALEIVGERAPGLDLIAPPKRRPIVIDPAIGSELLDELFRVVRVDGCYASDQRARKLPLTKMVCPYFRRSQAHECLIARVRTGQDGAGRAGARKPVGTRLWACRWT
jgi:hypothetical protein